MELMIIQALDGFAWFQITVIVICAILVAIKMIQNKKRAKDVSSVH